MAMKDNTAIVAEKPLNATQLKSLERIVQGDFEDLADSIELEITQQKTARLREIEEKFADTTQMGKAQEELIARGREIQDQYRAELAAMRQKYPTLSIPDTLLGWAANPGAVTQEGKAAEATRVKDASNRLLNHARSILRREQRKTQRVILLQGVTPVIASDILNDMPEASDILGIVSAEMGVTASEDMDILTGKARRQKSITE